MLENQNNHVLVTREAPDFTAPAVLGNGEIIEDYNFLTQTKGKYRILCFYPLDFTFVCPSELIALNHRIPTFKERNTEVIGISIDSHFTHNAWRNASPKDGGIGAIDFTLVADVSHKICRAYGIEHPEAAVALRAAFIIDRGGIIHAQIVNDLPLGRNMDELIRLIDALQFHEEHGEVCPAGWQQGEKGMQATSQGVANYLSKHEKDL